MSDGTVTPPLNLGESAGDDVVLNDLLNADLSNDTANESAGGDQVAQPAANKKTPKKAPAKKKSTKAKDSSDDAADKDEPTSPSAAAPKTVKKRAPAKTKAKAAVDNEDPDSSNTPAPPSAKKRATPKKKEPTVVADDENPKPDSAPTPTPAKKRQYKKKEVAVATTEGEEVEGEGTPVKTPAKKPAAPKRTPKSKVKVEVGDDEAVEEDAGPATPAPKAIKKRKAGESDSTSPKKRNKPEAIGATYEDLNDADKLTIKLRLVEKKAWPEIEDIVERETGVRHGKDVLRKSRWPKLEAVSVQFSDEDIQAFLAVKTKVDKSYWNHVSDEMKNTGITLSAKVLEAKYKWLQENNRIDVNGLYIVPERAPVAETTPPASPAAKAAELAETADVVEVAKLADAAEEEIQADIPAEADVEAVFQNGQFLDFGNDDEILQF